jgi:methylenetetrahydrofolate reductase (NADPH)
MRLKELFEKNRPSISVEFFPPKTPQGEENLARRIAEIVTLKPSYCSVTYGAGGGTRDKTLWWAKRLREEFGFEVMCHLTCVGHSRSELDQILDDLAAAGIENIIALRGDPPAGVENWEPHPDGYHYAIDLVKAAKRHGGFGIAVAGFPETHHDATSREADIKFLAEKVAAGADAVVTQLFFDNRDFHKYVADARAAGVTVPIVAGILPFKTKGQLDKFVNIYARTFSGPANIPAELQARLDATQTDEDAARLGIEWATEQCRELLDSGVDGIHFYCLNESQNIEQIMRTLKLTTV